MADDLKILNRGIPPAPAESPTDWVPGKIRKLSEVPTGHVIKIMAVQLAEPARSQLHRQGLLESCRARIIHNDHRGRVMLRLNGDLYLLGRRETPQIQVREYLPR